MMQVHLNGRGIAGVYPWEVAETKADDRHALAQRGGSSLCEPPSRSLKRSILDGLLFSASLEIVLTIAFREAVSRRHAYLTLEHLLYALAHDPDGERILGACGADLPRLRRDLDAYLDESIEQFAPRAQEREPEQTAAFRRVLQKAVLHVQSAQRNEVQAGDILAAMLQQPKTHAARLLADQGITRLDILDYISHGITKTPHCRSAAGAARARRPRAAGDEGPRHGARSAGRLLRRT